MDPQPSATGSGRPPLVIVGASCRAAAESAAAAGWAVHAADLFADLDLAAAAVVTRRVVDYPSGLAEAATSFPAGPWCYTGALENHFHALDRIAMSRPLAGNATSAIQRVRHPAMLAALVRGVGLRYPDVFLSPAHVPTDGSFLRKPLAGAGGRRIEPWTATTRAVTEATYWQRRIPGEPLAAVLALANGTGRLLGVSRQLLGVPWCNATAFAYCGSIGIPLERLPAGCAEQFRTLAAALAGDAGLSGIVGVDCVLEVDGRIAVIEVNPRPPASAELVERATGESVMAAHLAAFGLPSPTASQPRLSDDTIWAKGILFASESIAIDVRMLGRVRQLSTPWSLTDGAPAIADIPPAGQVLRDRAPVMTIFARGGTPDEAFATLRGRVEATKAIMG